MLDDRFLNFCGGFVKDTTHNLLIMLMTQAAPSTELQLIVSRSAKNPAERKAARAFFRNQFHYEATGCTFSARFEDSRLPPACTMTLTFRPTAEGSVSILGTRYVTWAPFAPGEGSMCRTRGGLRITDPQGHKAELLPSLTTPGAHELVEVRSARQDALRASMTALDDEDVRVLSACATILMENGVPELDAHTFLNVAEMPSFSMSTLDPKYDRMQGFTAALRELRAVHVKMIKLAMDS